jgi:hypothetical protein
MALDASLASRFDIALRAPSGAVTLLLSAAPATSTSSGTGVAQGAASVVVPLSFAGLSPGLYDLRISVTGGDAGAPAGDTAGAGTGGGAATALSRTLLPPSPSTTAIERRRRTTTVASLPLGAAVAAAVPPSAARAVWGKAPLRRVVRASPCRAHCPQPQH